MSEINAAGKRNGLLSRVIGFLEYLFLFVVIAECNSMFSSALLTDVSTDMTKLFYGLAIALVAVLLVLHALADPRIAAKLKRFMPVWLLLVAYIGVFYLLNVRHVSDGRRENYIRNFAVLLPLMTLLFKLKQQKGEGLDLLFKHSDITCAIAAMSLVVYLAGVFHVNTMPAETLYTKWGGAGSIRERVNLLNVCMLIPGEKWQISGIELQRHTGFFVEALMFSIPLITALHTELFLRKRADRRHLYRAVLLSAALITANSTVGVMLMAVGWGMKIISEEIKTGRRWLGLLTVVAIVGVCAALYLAKKGVRYEASGFAGTSIVDHIEDYRAGFRAFLHRPLLGGGYNYEAYIREFMDPAKVARNPGLSNSVATVLGEGGAMLGLLCMLPFLLGLLYAFRKRDRDMAFWTVGVLGLYVGVIFVYHIFLMFLFALGYSLIEIGREENGGHPWRLSLAELQLEARADAPVQPELLRRQRRRALGLAGAIALAGGLLVWLGVPVFRVIHNFLRTHQFSVTQSPIKAFGFNIVVLFHGVCVGNVLRRERDWKRLIALLAWDAIYLLVYPRLFSDFATILTAHNSTGGRMECAAMLGVYFIGGLIALEAPAAKKWLSVKGAVAACAIAACACGAFLATQALVNRIPPLDDSLAPKLNELTDAASGKVYAGELPSLYHRANGNLAWSSTGVSGYETYDCASILYRKGNDRWELFDNGFRVAELAEDCIVYSNDERLISDLAERGVTFYRYYPFERSVDLEALAHKNGLELTEDGALLVGEGKNLETGPSDALRRSWFTISYALHVDPETLAGWPEDAPLCSLVVSGWNGDYDFVQKPVTAGELDENGDGTIRLLVDTVKFCGNVEYRARAEADATVEVRSITVRETPDYITTTHYNCFRNPIREEYYSTDGTPHVQAEGYAAQEMDYNMNGTVRAVRYFDADGQPVQIGG